jgi:hypothetical protein
VQHGQPLEWLKDLLDVQHFLPARAGILRRDNADANPNANPIPRHNTHATTDAHSKSNPHPVANPDAFTYTYCYSVSHTMRPDYYLLEPGIDHHQ